jgi:hypothetical protein
VLDGNFSLASVAFRLAKTRYSISLDKAANSCASSMDVEVLPDPAKAFPIVILRDGQVKDRITDEMMARCCSLAFDSRGTLAADLNEVLIIKDKPVEAALASLDDKLTTGMTFCSLRIKFRE